MIKLNHADKYYNRGSGNELHVMNDITLELPESGLIAVFGKSGCGKTTLLNAIGGLDRLNSGEITVFGEDMGKNADIIRNKYIGYIFQNYNLSKNETVFENVADALRLCGMEDAAEIKERVIAALTNVGMEKFKNRQPDTLSGGQQQRVAIARALVKNPAILLADEPTGNLDEANTILIMDILKQISRDHLVILVTHEANLVDYYCDRVIEIVDGKVNSIHENANANGYSSRNKNDVYLGELTKSDTRTPGVHIRYYGEPKEEIELQIVSIDGKLYLKSGSPNLKILDDSSEVKFREGVFEEATPENGKQTANIDMSHLKPIEGKRFGKLFSFKSAMVSGYRENFSKKSKKGRKLLRASMFLLACVVVFMSANFAVSIRSLSELRENHSDNIFYLPLTNETDTTVISDHLGENGIDYARVIGGYYLRSADTIPFRVGNFVTASVSSVSASGNVLDSKLSENLPLVCGTRDFEKPLDVIITTALADDLIESSGASFVEDYTDLLNMVSENTYDGDNYMRITGIVKSNEKNYYLGSLYSSYVILKNIYGNGLQVTPAFMDTIATKELGRGQVCALTADTFYAVGSKVTIMGKTYTVAEAIRTYVDISQYADYVYDTYGIKLQDQSAYVYEKMSENPEADETQLCFEWFFEHYSTHYQDFLKACGNLEFYSWMYRNEGNIIYMIESMQYFLQSNYVGVNLYQAYIYHQNNGHYPTETEFKQYISNGNQMTVDENEYYMTLKNGDESYWNAFNEYQWQNSGYGTGFVMNDEDYTALAYQTGTNDSNVYLSELFGTYLDYYGEVHYSNYLLIHTDDAESAYTYLNEKYGDLLVTPDEVFDGAISEFRTTIIADLISLAVVILLISLCVYFIMRSSLMSRVKEIGIYRAIGVSKKNLTFRFMVESLVLTTLSLLIGFIIASAVVMKLSTFSLMSDVLYLPIWLAALLLALLYGITLLFGTMPVRMLLRRTPSEILAKYDI